MRLAELAIRGLAWTFAEIWTAEALRLLVFFVLARLLAPDSFGLVALGSTFIAFANILVDQGFPDAIVQRAELNPEHLDSAFWVNLAMAALMALAGVLLAPWISSIFGEPRLTGVLSVLCLMLPISGLGGVQRALLRRNLEFRSLAIRTLSAVILGGAAGATMALAGFGVWSLVGQMLVGNLTATAYLWIASDWRPGTRFDLKSSQELLNFGLKLVAGRIIQFFNTRGDNLIVGYFLGATSLGYYTIGCTLFERSLNLVRGGSIRVAYPLFSRLQKEPATLRRHLNRATGMISLLAFPFFTLLLVSGPDFVAVFFGSKWQHSAPVLQALSVAGYPMSTIFLLGVALQAMGYPGRLLSLSVFNTLARLAAILVLVHWGIIYVALGYALLAYCMVPLTFRVLKAALDVRFADFWKSVSAPFAGSALMGSILLALQQTIGGQMALYTRFVAFTAVAFSAYLLFMYMARPEYASEIRGYVRLILPVRKRTTR